jgi:hypothetical protein
LVGGPQYQQYQQQQHQLQQQHHQQQQQQQQRSPPSIAAAGTSRYIRQVKLHNFNKLGKVPKVATACGEFFTQPTPILHTGHCTGQLKTKLVKVFTSFFVIGIPEP